MDCVSCQGNERIDELPLSERIGADRYWRVAHASGTALPGWLVLIPRRHVTAVADLTDDDRQVPQDLVDSLAIALSAHLPQSG